MATSVAYLPVALLLGFLRRKTRPFELVSALRALISGVRLPVTLTLAAVPIYPEVMDLFNTQTMQTYLMISGMVLTVLSLYGLLK